MMDVREPAEFKRGRYDGALNLPLDQLRGRLDELSRDKEIWTYCFVGQRSYYAARILAQNGFQVKNISGGFKQFGQFQAARDNRKPEA
jgi:rhodanese-related sulfurtransferase